MGSRNGFSSLWVLALVFVVFVIVIMVLLSQQSAPVFLDKLRAQVAQFFSE